MKYLLKTASTLALLAPLSMGVNAAESSTPAQQPQGMNMQPGQGGMDMMGMMGGMSPEEQDKHLRMEQEHKLQMHDLSNKILSATDPKEKEKLKNQQLELMKTHKAHMMQMMHGNMKMPMGGGQPGMKMPMGGNQPGMNMPMGNQSGMQKHNMDNMPK